MPDQNDDNAPTECTGYAQTDLATDEDGVIYSPDYTFAQTLRLTNSPPESQGADLRASLKSTIAYGLLPKAEAPFSAKEKGQTFVADWQRWLAYVDRAQKNAKPAFFTITGPYDAFDNIRSALWLNQASKQGISIGTPWYPEWSATGSDGIAPLSDFSRDPNSLPWHNWAVKGFTTIKGVPYFIGKSWAGPKFGDKGFTYFSRENINGVLAVRGTGAFTIAKTGNRLWSLFGILVENFPALLTYLPQLFKIAFPDSSPTVPPAPQLPPEAPVKPVVAPFTPQPSPTTPARTAPLETFCLAIRSREGWFPGSRSFKNNNPGNCRYSSVGYAAVYHPVLRDKDGFAIFKDYATGWLYLQNLVRELAKEHPTWSVLDFFNTYSPAADANDPVSYAKEVAAKLGANYQTFVIANLI